MSDKHRTTLFLRLFNPLLILVLAGAYLVDPEQRVLR